MPQLTLDVLVTGADGAADQLRSVGSAAEEAGKQASGASKGFKAIGTAVAGIGLLTSGVFGLVDAQDDLARSDNNAARARRRASELTEKRIKAENALAEAMSGTGQQMELQIPAGKEFVRLWGDTEVQVRNANGEVSTIPRVYKSAGGAVKSLAQLQDEAADAAENERIGLERASLATKDNTKEHQRMGIQYAKNAGEIAAGAGMFLPMIESGKNLIKSSPKIIQSVSKVAGAAGLMGAAVIGVLVASEEIEKVRMADPEFVKRVEKDTKALEKQSVAQAAVNNLAQDVPKAFADIGRELDKIPAVRTIKLAVQDFISNPLGTIVSALDKIPGFKDVRLAVQDFLSDPLGSIVSALDQIPGFKEVRLAVQDFLSDPLGNIVSALDQIPGFKEVRLAVQDFLSDPLGTIVESLDKIPGFKEVRLAVQDFLSDPLGTIVESLDQIPGFKEVRLAVQDFLSDPLGNIVSALDQIPGFKEVRLAVQDFLSDPLGNIVSALDTIPGFKEVRLAVQDFLSDPLGKIVSALDTIPGFKEVRLAVQDFLSDPLGKIVGALDTIPGFKEVRLAVQDFISDPLGTIVTALDTIPGFKEVRLAVQDFISGALGTIQAAIDRIPILKSIQIALTDFVTDPLGTIQAAIDRVPLFKSIQVALMDFATDPLGTIQAAIDRVPTRKNITIGAESSAAVTAITEIGRALGLIPPETKTTVTANTQQAETNIGGLVSRFAEIPPTKTSTVTANTSVAQAAVDQLSAAIFGIKNKEATITVSVQGGASSSPGNIGGFVSRFARRGMTDVVTRPTNIRVGEGFHPELVNVTPLTSGVGRMSTTSSGTALHPHAAAGGTFVSGIGQMISDMMTGVVDSIAKNVRRNEQQVQERRYQLGFQNWNRLVGQTQTLIRKTADEVVQAQRVLANAMGNPSNSPVALAGQQKAIADLQYKYAEYSRRLTSLMATRPTPPNVTVQVTAAANGFGPSMVRKPTLFMAGEAGPEMVNVGPMAKGMRGFGGGGGGFDFSRLIEALERMCSSRFGAGGGAGGNRMLEANLIVDGQRMASIAQKYIGSKSYGDR